LYYSACTRIGGDALKDTFDDERYYQAITPTPALSVPATIQAVAPATAATTVIASDNSFQSEYIPVPRDERYEFAASMMPRDTRMYDTSGLVSSAAVAAVVADTGSGSLSSNPLVPVYRGDERHYYPVVSTITSSYLLDNRQYEQSLNSPSMMHDRLYQPTTHTITSGMLYNERSHYETASGNIAAITAVGGSGGHGGGGPHPSHLAGLSNSGPECHAVDIMMRSDATSVATAATVAGIEHAEASWRAEMMERQDEIDRQYLVLLPREDKIEPQDDL
ncbi:uncharacterized protein LOC128270093, partial [Anopheles cruzii]|uniref:uncharacterized protein LOC128270093 n=1 Tax=Anopheles cruzii TaxID=68878 RepID=UPI0022EC7880